MNLRLLLRCALIVAVFSLTVSDIASAIDYPTKALTIIVPFSPGGSADVQARLIAKGLSKRLGKPVVIDNRPGAGGTIGASLASRAPADGYTLLHSNFSMLVSEPISPSQFRP
jgi:tripartite-type tricarboxylate transporter receptor subunit TctC